MANRLNDRRGRDRDRGVFEKETAKSPRNVIARCQKRFKVYDRVVREEKHR